jgi:hypothetical protein
MKNINKASYRWLVLTFLFVIILVPALAQNNKEDKEAGVKALLQSGEFVFKAQNASPMRGRTIQLTSDYDVVFSKDSIRTYLPYYGRAYMAQPYASTDGGIKMTTTDFNYKLGDKKKKRWNITVEPADKTSVQQLILNVSKSGYATLQVTNTNRDPISFYGYITERN